MEIVSAACIAGHAERRNRRAEDFAMPDPENITFRDAVPANGERVKRPDDQPGAALSLSATPGNAYALSSDLTREHCLFQVRSSGGLRPGQARLPLNISLVIDRSGSMDGEPLEQAKRACALVVDMLEPTDVLSVITFEDGADVVMPARRMTNKVLVKDYISRIHAGNTTNLYEGLVTACQQVASVKTETSLNRVLLLTDGEPTAGTKDFPSIIGQVGEQKARGITVSTLGYGPDFSDELLSGIARRSGGNCYYAARPQELPTFFQREVESLLRITARNLRLRVYLPRGVSVRQVYGQQPVLGPRTAEVTLSDVEQGTGLSSLWELEMTPRPAGTYRVVLAELLYDDASTGRPEKLSAEAVVDFTTDRPLIVSGGNARVSGEAVVAQAARALDKAALALRAQQIDPEQALAEMEQAKGTLLEQGKPAQARLVSEAIQSAEGGAQLIKTLMGIVYSLDQGKIQ